MNVTIKQELSILLTIKVSIKRARERTKHILKISKTYDYNKIHAYVGKG